MSDSVSLFFAFRLIQTRLMILSIIHGLNPNQKLKAILEGCAISIISWGSTLEAHQRFSHPFSYRKSGSHTFTIFNPSSTLDQLFTTYLIENTVEPKRNWSHAIGGNIKTCSSWPQSLFLPAAPTSGAGTCPQEWQPRLNYPFICQFFPSEDFTASDKYKNESTAPSHGGKRNRRQGLLDAVSHEPNLAKTLQGALR